MNAQCKKRSTTTALTGTDLRGFRSPLASFCSNVSPDQQHSRHDGRVLEQDRVYQHAGHCTHKRHDSLVSQHR